MNRRHFVRLALAGFATTPRDATALPAALPRVRFARRSWAMGQLVELELYHHSEAAAREAAEACLAELRRVEARLSRFDDASDLAELNRRAGRGPWRAGRDLVAVLHAARMVRGASAGAFDPAVEPLMRAWGFREPRATAPGARELAAARDAVVAGRFRLEGGRVELPSRASALDLGGIAVGYGLDCCGAVLRRCGVGRALINVSGDCLALGAPPGETAWTVGVSDPDKPGLLTATVSLRDQALATSSNRAQTIRLTGRLAGHVMDPAAGAPADRVRQVTVTARSALLADAWSTALLVRGVPGDGVETWYEC